MPADLPGRSVGTQSLGYAALIAVDLDPDTLAEMEEAIRASGIGADPGPVGAG